MRSRPPQPAHHPHYPLPYPAVALVLGAAFLSVVVFPSCGGGGGVSGGGGSGTEPPPAALVIVTDSLRGGTVEQSYDTSLVASGGTKPYTWSLASESSPLPPDLVLSSAGTINGHPTTIGTYSFNLQVRDSRNSTATRVLTIDVREPLVISSAAAPSGLEGRQYSFRFEATGGLVPYTWTIHSGGLPQGLTLDSSGLLSGTPNSGGTFYIQLKVKDSDSRISYSNSTIYIVRALKVVTSSLPDTNVGWGPEYQLFAEGGLPPFHWGLAPGSGQLPEGLTIADHGEIGWISGVPTQAGNFSFTVQVTDNSVPSQTATRDLQLIVGDKLYVREENLPIGVIERNYRERIRAFGGIPPYSWNIVSGNLPLGLELDAAAGEIKGIPEGPVGYVYLLVRATDSSSPPQTASSNIGLIINPPVVFRTKFLPDAIQGVDYALQSLEAQYGKPPYTFRQVAGELPTGIFLGSLSSDGTAIYLGGTATTLGLSRFTIEVMDSSSPPTVATREFSIRVSTLLRITTTTLPQGWVGELYNAPLTVEGGVSPYTWTVYYLPSGLAVDESSGVIAGIPKAPPYQYPYIRVRDSAEIPQTAEVSLMLPIAIRLVITSRVPAGRPNVPYKVKLGLAGGTAPYTWSLTTGTLPDGLFFDPATWQIYGTPTAEGTSNFTLQVTDTGPPVQTVTKELSLKIASDLGRNDDPATATPISNGTFRASISPFAEPVAGPANPDHDFYELSANPGSVVAAETTAMRLSPASPLDTVLEILDADGNRLSICRRSRYDPPGLPCLNDDMEMGNTRDSRLEFQVPESETGPVTFYVHVFSWDGNARPDYVYELTVSGAN